MQSTTEGEGGGVGWDGTHNLLGISDFHIVHLQNSFNQFTTEAPVNVVPNHFSRQENHTDENLEIGLSNTQHISFQETVAVQNIEMIAAHSKIKV